MAHAPTTSGRAVRLVPARPHREHRARDGVPALRTLEGRPPLPQIPAAPGRPLPRIRGRARATAPLTGIDRGGPARYADRVSTDIQQRLAGRIEEAIEGRSRILDRDPEYRALRKLAQRNRAHPPRTPVDALQHVADVAREMTHARYSALAVTGATDYVEGFIVSGMSERELQALKGPPQGHGPLGTMRQDGLAVYFKDLAEHARAFGFPPKHPEMKELMGLPIFCGADVRGALYVTDRDGGRDFGADDKRVLEVLARHAGLIIEASWY